MAKCGGTSAKGARMAYPAIDKETGAQLVEYVCQDVFLNEAAATIPRTELEGPVLASRLHLLNHCRWVGPFNWRYWLPNTKR